jgi:hypothetical protein
VMAERRSVVPGVALLGEDGLAMSPSSTYACSAGVFGFA